MDNNHRDHTATHQRTLSFSRFKLSNSASTLAMDDKSSTRESSVANGTELRVDGACDHHNPQASASQPTFQTKHQSRLTSRPVAGNDGVSTAPRRLNLAMGAGASSSLLWLSWRPLRSAMMSANISCRFRASGSKGGCALTEGAVCGRKRLGSGTIGCLVSDRGSADSCPARSRLADSLSCSRCRRTSASIRNLSAASSSSPSRGSCGFESDAATAARSAASWRCFNRKAAADSLLDDTASI